MPDARWLSIDTPYRVHAFRSDPPMVAVCGARCRMWPAKELYSLDQSRECRACRRVLDDEARAKAIEASAEMHRRDR